jgi:hypothetical protein
VNETSCAKVTVTAELVQALATANGLPLALERAAPLVPALQAILDADLAISALPIHTLPAVGLPWEGVPQAPEQTSESDSRG